MTGPNGLLAYTRRAGVLGVLIAVCDEAVRAGRLASHRLGGINLAHSDVVAERTDFVFPSHKEVSLLAQDTGIAVWLMRACGLRVCEAHAVAREDFRDGGTMLRVSGQASLDGTKKVPLKHRRAGEYRDVPVPAYLWALVEDLPDGRPVCRARSRVPATRPTTRPTRRSSRPRSGSGCRPGFTPHSLRHAFASALLTNGVPITDVAEWLGHRSISETYKTYSHLLPAAAGKAKAVLDREYDEWSNRSL